jgi:hypothetical protein
LKLASLDTHAAAENTARSSGWLGRLKGLIKRG